MNNDVIIIGGGAAGLSAALSASGHGAKRVTVLEASPRVGRKILASGNGRCNLANLGELRYYGDAGFARQVMAACPADRVLSFFHDLGLITVEEAGKRVYPGCGQASAVLDTLRSACRQRGVREICDAKVTALEKTDQGFLVRTAEQTYSARRIIAACGGMAGGKLGHDGSPYRLLTALGHTLVEPHPALSQLVTERSDVKGLAGLRLPARLTLCNGLRPVSAAQGEVLFTDYGVSGVCAMQLSRDADSLLRQGKRPRLCVDFSPMLGLIPRVYDRVEPEDAEKNLPLVRACLLERRHMLPGEEILTGLAPRLLIQRMRGMDENQMAQFLACFTLPLTGVKGFENAQVTSGGISCREFDPANLQSRLHPGLYCLGEMLNVDGDCGGYNLQFAFACGILSGAHAAG